MNGGYVDASLNRSLSARTAIGGIRSVAVVLVRDSASHPEAHSRGPAYSLFLTSERSFASPLIELGHLFFEPSHVCSCPFLVRLGK